jgi:hypothetical protein
MSVQAQLSGQLRDLAQLEVGLHRRYRDATGMSESKVGILSFLNFGTSLQFSMTCFEQVWGQLGVLEDNRAAQREKNK